MRVLEIIRLEDSPEHGTIGVLRIDKEVFCFTLEPTDLLNQPNSSCIPDKQYTCKRITSPRFGETFEITGIPGRSHVLFHAGNTVGDTKGCPLLGDRIGKLRSTTGSQRAILNSGNTFKAFMSELKDELAVGLTITKAY